jgi:zinc protease
MSHFSPRLQARVPHRPVRTPPIGGRWSVPVLAVLLSFAASPPAAAQERGGIALERFTLANGLEVIFAPDRGAPVVAVDIWYEAGARTVPPGKAGLARLFERLMFAGTEHVPPGAHAALVADLGGESIAEVSEEGARFGATVPAERLNLALWLEAERMRGLAITDTSVNDARLGQMGDIRDRLTSDPYTGALLDAVTALYDSTTCAGYAQPAIGRATTLSGITTAEVRQFYVDRYSPTGARLVVSGHFDVAEARRLVMEYFNDIPRGKVPPPVNCEAKPTTGPERRTVTDRQAARPAAAILYRLPPHDHPDTPALELLEIMLTEGSGARLPTVLEREQRVAVATQGGIVGDRRVTGAFLLLGVSADGVTADSLAGLLAAQAAWIGSDSVALAALERAKNIYRATAASERERMADIANLVQHAAAFHGAPEQVNAEPTRVLAVTLDDVRRVARAWLRPENAMTLLILPPEERR